ncbi:MAG: ABC transporter permease [Armatimonadetes bacterium]|jgi:ABC-type transport system involved in multi-copper enzyme maturation permease subunit|nr:ABC transporter permease [Armatimonadota bacterium]
MNTAIVIARNTISEALRKKVLNAFLMVGFAMLVLTFAFQQFAPRQELTLVKGMGLGIISMAALLITVILSINLVPTEIERRTIYTILSKPVRRHEFLLGKYFGAASTIFINVGLMGLAFVLAIILKQRGVDMGSSLNMLKGVWMIYCQMALLSAVAIFFSTFLSPLVNFFLTFSLFIVGNLSSFTLDLAKNTQNVLAKGFFTIVHYLVPNFGNFNYTNPLVQANVQVKSEAALLTQNTIYALVYATVLLIISILVFDRREV